MDTKLVKPNIKWRKITRWLAVMYVYLVVWTGQRGTNTFDWIESVSIDWQLYTSGIFDQTGAN